MAHSYNDGPMVQVKGEKEMPTRALPVRESCISNHIVPGLGERAIEKRVAGVGARLLGKGTNKETPGRRRRGGPMVARGRSMGNCGFFDNVKGTPRCEPLHMQGRHPPLHPDRVEHCGTEE